MPFLRRDVLSGGEYIPVTLDGIFTNAGFKVLMMQQGTTVKGSTIPGGVQTLAYQGLAGGTPLLSVVAANGKALTYISSQSADYAINEGFSGAARQQSCYWRCSAQQDNTWNGDLSQGFTTIAVMSSRNHNTGFSSHYGSWSNTMMLMSSTVNDTNLSTTPYLISGTYLNPGNQWDVGVGTGGVHSGLGTFCRAIFDTFYPTAPANADVNEVVGYSMFYKDSPLTVNTFVCNSDGSTMQAIGGTGTTAPFTHAFPSPAIWTFNLAEQGGFPIGTPVFRGFVASTIIVGQPSNTLIQNWFNAIFNGVTF
jgi:hypothetical protein